MDLFFCAEQDVKTIQAAQSLWTLKENEVI